MLRQQKTKTLLLILLFSSATFAGGWFVGSKGYEVEFQGSSSRVPKVQIVNQETKRLPQTIDFSVFWKVWDTLEDRHVDRPFDPQQLLYGALKGLAEAVGDPYTAFLPPPENKEVQDNLNGRYEGIGAELGIRDELLTIISPLDGSPAEAAGVKPGDVVLEIDGEETAALNLNEAVSKIRGPAETAVVLTLLRDGDEEIREPFPVEIIRQQITIKSVSWEQKDDGIAYIRVARFGEATNTDWDRVVDEIVNNQSSITKAIILDVRSNSGGYLQASIHIASEFTNTGVIVYEEFGDGQRREFKSDHQGRLTMLPVVVLINGGSASASEILAGALRDLKGSQLVGEQSFGKGTVQDAIEFIDGSSIHVTIARWLTPNGDNIDDAGLAPAVVVERTEEELDAGVDSQLEKAIEIGKGL